MGAAEARPRLAGVMRPQALWTRAEGGGAVPVNPSDGERTDGGEETPGASDGAVKLGLELLDSQRHWPGEQKGRS